MHLIRLVFGWYIKASIHVSLALVSLVAFTGRIFGIEVSLHYFLALFFGSIAAYNGIKYGLEPGRHPYRVPGGFTALIVLSLFCLAVALYHGRFRQGLFQRLWGDNGALCHPHEARVQKSSQPWHFKGCAGSPGLDPGKPMDSHMGNP